MTDTINHIIEELIRFRDERDWEQFHDSKNLALAISIEAAELNELFLWKKDTDEGQVDREKIGEELADIIAFSFLLAHKHKYDIGEMVLNKIRKNAQKYPVTKAKGVSTKYNKL